MKRSGLRKAFNKGPILASQYWSVVGLRVAREYFVIDLNCILDFYNIKNFYLDNFILISNNKKNYKELGNSNKVLTHICTENYDANLFTS